MRYVLYPTDGTSRATKARSKRYGYAAQHIARFAELADRLIDCSADFRLTETAKMADVVVPGATWAEKEGTITNVDGFVSKLNRAIRPPAAAAPDLDILLDLLKRANPEGEFPTTPEGVFRKLGEKVPAFAGIRYSDIFNRSRPAAIEATASAD